MKHHSTCGSAFKEVVNFKWNSQFIYENLKLPPSHQKLTKQKDGQSNNFMEKVLEKKVDGLLWLSPPPLTPLPLLSAVSYQHRKDQKNLEQWQAGKEETAGQEKGERRPCTSITKSKLLLLPRKEVKKST